MYLHTNSVYWCSYSALLQEGIHTKMKLLFWDVHRNNVLLWKKFEFITFKSQYNCIGSTPTSTLPILLLSLLQNGINLALKNYHDMLPTCHLHMPSYRCTRAYVLPTRTSSTTSCISVICERNKCTNTLCSSGDTLNNSTVVLDLSRDTTCDQLLHGHTEVPDACTSGA